MHRLVGGRASTASLLEAFPCITIAMYWSWEGGLREQPPRPLRPARAPMSACLSATTIWGGYRRVVWSSGLTV
ncbi:MAG: hypothetical protein RLZZ153_2260 [Pseudomonadota bacterium]